MQGGAADPDPLGAEVLLTLGVLNWSLALSMFLLGPVAGRTGVLARPAEHTRLWQALLVLALVVGLPGGLASAYLMLFAADPGGHLHVVGVALGFALAPALTGGYVALAALATGRRLLRFTGHLGESALMGAVFAGWGLGLYGRLGFTATAFVTLGGGSCWKSCRASGSPATPTGLPSGCCAAGRGEHGRGCHTARGRGPCPPSGPARGLEGRATRGLFHPHPPDSCSVCSC